MADFEFYEGFWSFSNDEIEILMDEATFDKYFRAYLQEKGLETRTYLELLHYAEEVQQQHKAAEEILFDPSYWLPLASDPSVRIVPRKLPLASQADREGLYP
ncbi:hypothetical protein EPA93_26360 [Ktedonosporobacter rubrisoli]|uniref:Uncharacterized protein n=1 Tax=Ktedonosporobacter rubrisoli TaxID=2509675 RepID=A0A4P6JVG3_KTERU|nr:hypothetical protein [Ktedonosporobacter rubrisoli]QBD79320.1 hypothetical protein EPA93_26360 [Ktedonosporobacter rubrisoli]